MATNSTNTARQYHRTSGNTVLSTHATQKVTPINRSRRAPRKKSVYRGEFLVITIVVVFFTAWLSCSLISVGFQHWRLSDRIESIEQYENSSYGAARWDADAIATYNEAIQARNDFANSSDLAKWSVYSAAGTFFGRCVRLAVYILAVATVVVDFCLLKVVVQALLEILFGKAIVKFDILKRLMEDEH